MMVRLLLCVLRLAMVETDMPLGEVDRRKNSRPGCRVGKGSCTLHPGRLLPTEQWVGPACIFLKGCPGLLASLRWDGLSLFALSRACFGQPRAPACVGLSCGNGCKEALRKKLNPKS